MSRTEVCFSERMVSRKQDICGQNAKRAESSRGKLRCESRRPEENGLRLWLGKVFHAVVQHQRIEGRHPCVLLAGPCRLEDGAGEAQTPREAAAMGFDLRGVGGGEEEKRKVRRGLTWGSFREPEEPDVRIGGSCLLVKVRFREEDLVV